VYNEYLQANGSNNSTIVRMEKSSLKNWVNVLKWLILIVSYSYLAYKLITFDQYDELAAHWKQMPASQLWWLVVTLILLPVNMLLEALKWKLFVSKIQKSIFSLPLNQFYRAFIPDFYPQPRRRIGGSRRVYRCGKT